MDNPSHAADPADFDSGFESGAGSYEPPPFSASASAQTQAGETSATEGAYWRENVRLLVSLMAVWFAVSFGAGILFRGWLDQFMLGGYPLGFWFAQQGSIYIFIALIFFYVVRMKQIERKYDLDD